MTTVQKLKQTSDTNKHIENNEIREHNETVGETNKSVIHVVPLVSKQNIVPKTITMVPLKNIVIRTVVQNEGSQIKGVKMVGKPEAYQKRKSMLSEYKELFAAIMKFSDKEMQKKLLNVINNQQVIEQRSVETQTDPVEFKETTDCTKEDTNKKNKHENVDTNDDIIYKIHHETKSGGEVIKKRKRKRKVSLPQVNKESRAKQLAKMNKPKVSLSVNGNNIVMSPNSTNDEGGPAKRQRVESLCLSECSLDVVNTFEDMHKTPDTEFQQYNTRLENGLIPIQDAVVRNQINSLSVHIKIWTHNAIDLNDILTDEDEDLLQLAILNTSVPLVVSMLLENKLNPNTLDADSNTIIHLAILNDVTVMALEHLMKHIDLKLLLTLNDDGYTPLHLAIRQDRYLLAECLINILDERLVNKVYYKRQLDELETDENLLKKQFKDYYEKICLKMISDDEETVPIENHELKQSLLQAGDRRSGNTALYFAIDNQFEHLAYFLLAHLTDPRTENLSGVDCKTYFSDYGKSLNLSLNIDNTMEKVIKLLS